MKPFILAFLGIAVAQAAPIRVMLLDGQSGGTYHDWRATTPVLKKQLEQTGLFQVDVVTAPASGGDFSNFHPDFKKYQVVVSNLDSPDWPADLMASFEQFVKNGGGLVVVHAADNAFAKASFVPPGRYCQSRIGKNGRLTSRHGRSGLERFQIRDTFDRQIPALLDVVILQSAGLRCLENLLPVQAILADSELRSASATARTRWHRRICIDALQVH